MFYVVHVAISPYLLSVVLKIYSLPCIWIQKDQDIGPAASWCLGVLPAAAGPS